MYINRLAITGPKNEFWAFMNTECTLFGKIKIGQYSCDIKKIGESSILVEFVSKDSVEPMVEILSMDWNLNFELFLFNIPIHQGRKVCFSDHKKISREVFLDPHMFSIWQPGLS